MPGICEQQTPMANLKSLLSILHGQTRLDPKLLKVRICDASDVVALRQPLTNRNFLVWVLVSEEDLLEAQTKQTLEA